MKALNVNCVLSATVPACTCTEWNFTCIIIRLLSSTVVSSCHSKKAKKKNLKLRLVNDEKWCLLV